MTKEIKLCSSCKGRGRRITIPDDTSDNTCHVCKGTGRVQIVTTVIIKPYPDKK